MLTTLARFEKPEEAHLARMKLGAAGIEAFVFDENVIQVYWFYSNLIGGVRLQVHEEDVPAALEALALEFEDDAEDGTAAE